MCPLVTGKGQSEWHPEPTYMRQRTSVGRQSFPGEDSSNVPAERRDFQSKGHKLFGRKIHIQAYPGVVNTQILNLKTTDIYKRIYAGI